MLEPQAYADGNADLLPEVDVVLAADCLNPVYGEGHAVALACTLARMLNHVDARSDARLEVCTDTRAGMGRCPAAVLAQTQRGNQEAEAVFFEACRARGLTWRRVALNEGAIRAASASASEVDVYVILGSALLDSEAARLSDLSEPASPAPAAPAGGLAGSPQARAAQSR